MKRRIIALCMTGILIASTFTGCGGTNTGSQTPMSTEKVTEIAAPSTTTAEISTEAVTETSKDSLTFECDSFKVEYVKHEVGKDYEGNPCLYYYFNFTNKGEEATSAMVTPYFQFFQNGIELEMAIADETPDEMNNYSKDIKKDVTLECCIAYELSDESDVEVKVSDWTSFDDNKGEQVLKLK